MADAHWRRHLVAEALLASFAVEDLLMADAYWRRHLGGSSRHLP